jgi:HSP20 family protein
MIKRVQLPTPPGYDLFVTPRRDINRLRGELEDLFDQAWGVPRFTARRCFRPRVDAYRTAGELVVLVELAGIDPESVHVSATDSGLVISGIRRRPNKGKGKGGHLYQQMEIDYGPFERHISLPEDVRAGEATATYERGFLKIVFPTAPQPTATERVAIPVRRPK